jgi:hypothetical protein
MNPEMTGGPDPIDGLKPVRDIVQSQPWYKEVAKSISAAVGPLIGIVWLATTAGFEIPDGVVKGGFIIIGVLTAVGVYQVPSGITQSQYDDIKKAYGRHHRRDA